MTRTATEVDDSSERSTSTGGDAARFISLYDVGLRFVDSGRRIPTRQTLIRRGAEFASRNGLTIHEVGRDRYVSTAEFDRVHERGAA